MLPKANLAHGSTVDLDEVRQRSWRSASNPSFKLPDEMHGRQLRVVHYPCGGDSAQYGSITYGGIQKIGLALAAGA